MDIFTTSMQNLNQNDRRIFFSSLAFSIVFLFLFLSYTPQFDVHNLIPIGTMKIGQDGVKRKSEGSLAWYDIYKGNELYKGDELFTGESENTLLDLSKFKLQMKLNPNSLVKLDFEDAASYLNLLDGEVLLNIKGSGEVFLIDNDKVVKLVAAEDSQFTAVKSSQGIGLKLIKGKASVDGKSLSKGEKIGAFPDPEPVVKIESPANGMSYLLEEAIPFKISDSHFKGEVFVINSTTAESKKLSMLEVSSYLSKQIPGKFEIQLKKKDKIVDAVNFELRTGMTIDDLRPLDKSIIEALDDKMKIPFVWKTSQAMPFTFMIWPLGEESRKAEFKVGSSNNFNYRPKKLGLDYAWKVIGKTKAGVRIESSVNSFKFLDKPKAIVMVEDPLPPRAKDQSISQVDYQGNKAYLIKVPSVAGASGYTFEIFKSRQDARPLFSIKSEKPEIFWVSKRSGEYSLRYQVISKTKTSRASEFSRVEFLENPPVEVNLNQLPAAKDQTIKLQNYNNGQAYLISAPIISNADAYQFEVYQNPNDDKALFTTKSDRSEFYWVSKRDGVFYLKYRIYNKNKLSPSSPLSKLELRD